MAVEIPLRRKYRWAHKSTYKGGERSAPPKKRVKRGYDKHVALFGEPPKVVLHVQGRTGKSRLVKS